MSKKKHEHEHSHDNIAHSHEHSHDSGGNSWMFLSIVLAVLLVASIFTNGFRFDNMTSAKASLNSLLKQNIPADAKSSITDALTSLDKAQTSITAALNTQKQQPTGNGQKVKLDFYVMSKCPYGTQVEDGVKPALDNLGSSVDFSVNFIANDNGDGTYQSLHGPTEVTSDLIEVCVMKYYPTTFMNFIACVNKDFGNLPNGWEACAQSNNMDAAKITTCSQGTEGKTLLSDSIKRSNAVNAQASPTMFINGQPYDGGRDALSFQRALCAQLQGNPACANMPACGSDSDCTAQADKVGKCVNPNTKDAVCQYSAPSAVNMVFINDKRCKDCQTATQLVGQLQSLFKGLKVTTYDYSDPAGKKIFQDSQVKVLPAFLFDNTVKDGESYTRIQNYLVPAGNYLSLRIGATFDPTAEICDNKIDDNGNGLVDCADSQCKDQIVCRQDVTKRLDLFVMSKCPYGIQAMNSMKEVLSNFNNVSFEIHSIATDNGDGTFTSLHGPTEVAEDLRESCVMKYYPETQKYMNYIWCRNANIASDDWQSCATQNGIDTNTIQACSTGDEGKQLLRAKIALSNSLNIGASPTWMANNRYEFNGLDANTIKTNLCQYNQGLAGCEKTLSGSTQAPSGVQCGQ